MYPKNALATLMAFMISCLLAASETEPATEDLGEGPQTAPRKDFRLSIDGSPRVGLWQGRMRGDISLEGWLMPLPGLSLRQVSVEPRHQRLTPFVEVDLESPDWPLLLQLSGFWHRRRGAEQARASLLDQPLLPPGEVSVSAEYNFVYAGLGLFWLLYDHPDLRLAPGISGQSVFARLKPDSIAIDLSVSTTVIFPALSLQAEWQASDSLRLSGSLDASSIRLGGQRVRFFQGILGLDFSPLPRQSAMIGYRYVQAFVSYPSANRGLLPAQTLIDLSLSGPSLSFAWEW